MSLIRTQINFWLDDAERRGHNTYGRSLEDADDGREWDLEVIQELVDALQYAAKDKMDLERRILVLERENEKLRQTPFGERSDQIPYRR